MHSTLEHNHGELYYETHGDGTPIVFLHGFTLDHRMWADQIQHFSKRNRVIVPDLRGFGRSSIATQKYSFQDDLNALFEELNLGKAYIVGLSFGGEVALDFTLEHQGKVLSLTVADSSLGGYASTVDWNVHADEVGVEGAKENWLNHDVFEATRRNKDVTKKLHEIVSDYSGWHWLQESFWPNREFLQPAAMKRLREISVPTQIIVGEKDLSYFHDIAKILSDSIEHAEKIVLSDVGHMSNMESPERFNATLERVL